MTPPPPINTARPSTRAAAAAAAAATDARAFGLAALMCAAATNLATGTAAVALCLGTAAVFAAASACATAAGGAPGYARARVLTTPLLVAPMGALHNITFYLWAGPRNALSPGPGWFEFWISRFGPLMTAFLTLSAGLPRGPRLAALLVAQAGAAILTTPAGCGPSLAAYPCLAYFYNRLADVWDAWAAGVVAAAVGGGWGEGRGGASPAGGAPPPPPPSPAACAMHACTAVTAMLYASVACLCWAAAVPARGRCWRGGVRASGPACHPLHARHSWRAGAVAEVATSASLLSVALAVGGWAVLAGLLPRPAGCSGGGAARAAEVHLPLCRPVR